MNGRGNSGLLVVLAGAVALGGCRSIPIDPTSLALRGASSIMIGLAREVLEDTLKNSPPYEGDEQLLLRIAREVPGDKTSFALTYNQDARGKIFTLDVKATKPKGFNKSLEVYADPYRDFVYVPMGNIHDDVSVTWYYEGVEISHVKFGNLTNPSLFFGLAGPNLIITHLKDSGAVTEMNGVLFPSGRGLSR